MADRRRRWLAGKPWLLTAAPWPARSPSGAELSPAFGAPSINDSAPAASLHSRPEAVAAFALNDAGLKSSFHVSREILGSKGAGIYRFSPGIVNVFLVFDIIYPGCG